MVQTPLTIIDLGAFCVELRQIYCSKRIWGTLTGTHVRIRMCKQKCKQSDHRTPQGSLWGTQGSQGGTLGIPRGSPGIPRMDPPGSPWDPRGPLDPPVGTPWTHWGAMDPWAHGPMGPGVIIIHPKNPWGDHHTPQGPWGDHHTPQGSQG